MRSVLDQVEGIGSKRKAKLLRTFGSIKKMRKASVDELKGAGLPTKVAENLHEKLKQQNKQKN